MERVLALGQDMALLWIRYAPLYLSGVVNTHRTACPGESCCGCSGP